jgi:hypothetical protein
MKYQPVRYVAVVVLERRIRKAFRSSPGPTAALAKSAPWHENHDQGRLIRWVVW